MSFPALFEHVSGTLKVVLEGGIFLGGITAILLNVLLNGKAQQEDEQRDEATELSVLVSVAVDAKKRA